MFTRDKLISRRNSRISPVEAGHRALPTPATTWACKKTALAISHSEAKSTLTGLRCLSHQRCSRRKATWVVRRFWLCEGARDLKCCQPSSDSQVLSGICMFVRGEGREALLLCQLLRCLSPPTCVGCYTCALLGCYHSVWHAVSRWWWAESTPLLHVHPVRSASLFLICWP